MDESTFTYKTIQTHAYSKPNKNYQLTEKETKTKTINLIAAISFENGFEGLITTDKPVTSKSFSTIFNEIVK